jgi:hypothetical protein
MAYDANLGGVAGRMMDAAQEQGCRFLFTVGELVSHVGYLADESEADPALLALANAVAFSWLLDQPEARS